jgi:hypothetical protein
MNETHGIIRAVIDFSDGKPKPTIVTAYQARTSDTSRYKYSRIWCQFSIYSFPFYRRDFRQARIDQTNGNVAVNPVVWANTAVHLEVVFIIFSFIQGLLSYICAIGTKWHNCFLFTHYTYTVRWLLDCCIHSSHLSWYWRQNIDFDNRNTHLTKHLYSKRV